MSTKSYFWTLAHQLKSHEFRPAGEYTIALEKLHSFRPQLAEENPDQRLEPQLAHDSCEIQDRIDGLWRYCEHHGLCDKYEDQISCLLADIESSEVQLRNLLESETRMSIAEKNNEPRSYGEAQKVIMQLEQELKVKRLKISQGQPPI